VGFARVEPLQRQALGERTHPLAGQRQDAAGQAVGLAVQAQVDARRLDLLVGDGAPTS